MKKIASVLSVALLAMLTGCSGSTPDYPETVSATGTITQAGKPVEGALVTYVPPQMAPGTGTADTYAASGRTAADGTYSMSTYFSPQVTKEGVVPGSYNVTVTKAPPATAADPNAGHGDHASEEATPAGPKSLLPKQYADPTGTPLRTNIEAGKESNETFDLK